MMDIREIQRLIPHRYPFLLIDRVLEMELGKRIVGLKNVTINEPFFVGHFPNYPIMPGVLILESLAQAGAILIKRSLNLPENKLMLFMGIDKAKFRKPVFPGDQLRLEMDLTRLHTRSAKARGRAYVEQALVVEAELLMMIADREEEGENR
jgi:beta-hydroxyacyl-ACP dehydratase FabZ